MKHGQASIRDRAAKLFNGDHFRSPGNNKVMQPCSACRVIRAGERFCSNRIARLPSIYSPPPGWSDLGRLQISPSRPRRIHMDPNSAVEARYVNYTALTKDEREISGIIVAEGANSLTLRSPTGEETVLRKDLQRVTSSGLSLMPKVSRKYCRPGSRRCNRLHQEEVGGADPLGQRADFEVQSCVFF